jgi:hypothetical protein
MGNGISNHIRSNVIGYIALFVSLSASAYALPGTNTVDSGDIVNGQVRNPDLADNSVGTAKIVDGRVLTPDLGASAVTTAKIGDGQVRTADLATDAVTTDKITDGQVTTADLATDAVTTDNIKNREVKTGDLANNAVNSGKVADQSLTGDDIAESTLGQVPSAVRLDDLDSTQLSPATGDGRTADLTLTGSYQTVLSANITTARSASLLVSAAVNLVSTFSAGARTPVCSVRVDGGTISVEYKETYSPGNMTLPVVWAQGVGAGAHTVEVLCRENFGETVVDNAGMTVSAHL